MEQRIKKEVGSVSLDRVSKECKTGGSGGDDETGPENSSIFNGLKGLLSETF